MLNHLRTMLGLCWVIMCLYKSCVYKSCINFRDFLLWATHEKSVHSQSTIISAANHCADRALFFNMICFFWLEIVKNMLILGGGGSRQSLALPRQSLVLTRQSLVLSPFGHGPVTVQPRSFFFFGSKDFRSYPTKSAHVWTCATRGTNTNCFSWKLGFSLENYQKVPTKS